MSKLVVFGCIIPTVGEELFWSGDAARTVRDQLLALPGTEYGIDWEFPQDTGLEDSNICVTNNANVHAVFEGKDAVYCCLQYLISMYGVTGAPGRIMQRLA